MSYTARILNYVEPYYIDGIAKTAFWTEVNTNLQRNDKVFIINGFYDSERFIRKGKWTKNADGYRVLVVDRCKVVLDIDWESGVFAGLTQTYRVDDFDKFIKVYNIRSQREFDYINKIYVDTYTASRVSKFERNLTNNIIYASNGWTGATGFGKNSGLGATNSFWAKVGWNWVDVTTQFLNKSFTFSSEYISIGLTNNSRIFVLGEDINYENLLLKERNIYKWGATGSWLYDTEYKQPIMSKLYFKTGVFKGIHNDGVFGTYLKTQQWNGWPSEWNSGFFVNSSWNGGRMKSKSTGLEQSYYSTLVNGLPVQTTDFSNNRSYGYNYILDSNFVAGEIDNGNFINCNIGSYSTGLTAVSEYFGLTNSYPLNIFGGLYNYCDIYNSYLYSSTTLDSIISNTFFEDSRTFNSQIKESYSKDGEFSVEEASINILSADMASYMITATSGTSSSIRSILKLYIDDKDLLRLDNLDSFYLNKINKEYILSKLDSDTRIWLPIETKYILDTFYDFEVNSENQECFASIKSKYENKYLNVVQFSGTTYSNTSILNDKNYASIDIDFSKYFAFYQFNNEYYYVNQSYIDKSTVDKLFTNTHLTNSDFRDGVAKNIVWSSGSHLNYPSNTIKWENNNLKITKVASNQIKVYLVATQSSINDEIFATNSYVWLDSIVHTNDSGVQTPITGSYTVATFSLDELTLQSSQLTSVAATGTFSVLGTHKPKYLSVHKLLIEDSTVKKGLFIKNLFRNTLFEDKNFDSNDRSLHNANIQKLRVLNHYFINSNNSVNTIRSGVFHNSHFTDVNWESGIADNSVWYGADFKGGVFNYGIWQDGTFSGGVFQNSRGLTYTPEDYSFVTTHYRNWFKGNFNGGEFYNSVWLDGTFNLGKFYGSDWYGGIWNNGILGDLNIPTANTTMAKYLNIGTGATYTVWYNGMVNNAEVGGQGYLDWYNGKFNSGIFSASASTSTNRSWWHNGQFNGGNFSGLAKWKSGTFNSGKFNSYFGYTLSSSTFSTSYGWESGEFKGGQFGEESTATNSIWFDGQFFDGIFKGKVWNTGIFMGGSFEGSGTISSISNPGTFSDSFTQSYWGLWRSGTVTDLQHKADPSFTVPVNMIRVEEIIPLVPAKLKNMLWLNGNFDHPYGEMNNSVWLNGKFKKGRFINSVFNPWVRRDWWTNSYGTYSSFNFDFSNCVWENGDFDGDFYVSDWLNGNFLGGTMSGARWFDGIWKYGNARNIYWENGTWKNGNWDGSPFDLSTLNLTQSEHRMITGKEKDMLLRIANIHQDGKIHVINAFTGSFTDNLYEAWTFSNTSSELSDWQLAFDNYWYLDYGLPSNPTITVTNIEYNTPDGYTTTTVTVSGSVAESDTYRVFVYDGYISLTASSTDTASSIATRLVDDINRGTFQQIVKKEEWTANGYLTRYFNWTQLDSRLIPGLPIAISTGSGIFTIQAPSDATPYVNSQSGFAGSSIYKQSERLYALTDDGTGLTTSIFTQSGILHNVSIDVYNYYGRTDLLVNVADNVYRETVSTTGLKTFNYSFESDTPETFTASTLYIERVTYENPDNSSIQVYPAKINRLESYYDDVINNRLYKFGTYSTPFVYGPTGSTVSLPGRLLTGLITNNEAVSVKFGNGAFKLGLWENGYWNNGWRAAWNDSEKEYYLYSDVVQGGFLQVIENLWIVKLKALTNTDGLSVGDRVSIGNLVFVDINEKRRLVKSWYRVINKTTDEITVEINVNFNVRRIEKDSSSHLIYISKNIWQSGVFHNGYFKGIWNYGLFRGYPYITEIVQSHWIDGIFDGGKFLSDKSYYLSQGLSQSYNDGLIQNFIFRDNNKGLLGKYKYNSWVDTNYFTSSMTNLLRENLRFDADWGVILSSGNLKGYPTVDVLSSTSIFRNSFDFEQKYYSLGYKLKKYVEFLKDASRFDYPFNTSGEPGVSDFLAKGWTYTANFITMHSNAKTADANVLQVNYTQESYSNIGVKFVQTKKIQYKNTNRNVTTGSPNGTYGWIAGDFSSDSRYTVYLDDVAQTVGTRFSNRSYAYNDWPLRTSRSGVQKLTNDIYNKETLSLFSNTTTNTPASSTFTQLGDTQPTWRRVYMLDLFNPTQSDATFGGYNRSGSTPNLIGVVSRTGANGQNVGGTDWNFVSYKLLNDTRLKINAFIPFELSAVELNTAPWLSSASNLERRNGWSTFKLVGVVERIKAENAILGNDEDKWEYVTSTEFDFYPDSFFGSLSGSNLVGFLVNKSNSTITFDSTTVNNKIRGYLKITGYEADFKKDDLLRFRLYWIDVRKMFASSNSVGDGAPGDMTLTIGKFSGVNYTENNHGYWEIIDTATYVNQNTNLLTNTKASQIERFRYSVVDFDVANEPTYKFQGTSSSDRDSLPSIFLLNSDYENLPGSFSAVINHGLTPGNKKEYFFNRKSLNLFFKSTETFITQFSKIDFYETDMIPFFRYTDESSINKDPQSPYYGTAPLEPIAEGSLSLDTISYTSPFQGNVPIRGAIQIPGGGGSGGVGPPPPPPPPPTTVYNSIDYSFVNDSDSGVNEFTSYYSIQEYTSTNTLVRTITVDHSGLDSTTSFLSVAATNYLELFVRGTFSTVAMNNQSRISIPALSYDNISSAGNYSQLTYTITPTSDLVITLQVEPELIMYYYDAYPYDCNTSNQYGSLTLLQSTSLIPLGYFACVGGTMYQLVAYAGAGAGVNISSSNAVCTALACYIP